MTVLPLPCFFFFRLCLLLWPLSVQHKRSMFLFYFSWSFVRYFQSTNQSIYILFLVSCYADINTSQRKHYLLIFITWNVNRAVMFDVKQTDESIFHVASCLCSIWSEYWSKLGCDPIHIIWLALWLSEFDIDPLCYKTVSRPGAAELTHRFSFFASSPSSNGVLVKFILLWPGVNG